MDTMGTYWDRVAHSVSSGYQSMWRQIAKRRLENDLNSIIDTVTSHKKNKVPAGASQYQSLWRTADGKINRFCSDCKVDRTEIEAQIPALAELKTLATVPPSHNRPARLAIGSIVVVIALITTGFLSGMAQGLVHVGWSLAQELMRHL